MTNDRSETLTRVCEALLRGERAKAASIAQSEYSFETYTTSGRKYSAFESTQIFVRDGFIDRYSGTRLVFPGSLRLVSHLMPDEFPAHPNWKMSESHIVYWELFPTIDHIIPVARGGNDCAENWVSTSMLRNSAKSNWTLDELGWNLYPSGNFREWDGLIGWFFSYIDENPQHLQDKYLKRWHGAVVRAIDSLPNRLDIN